MFRFAEAKSELKSSQRKISEWFKELQHYGFIVLVLPGRLGVEGRGKAPHWRLTELGSTPKASADGLPEPPTRDFLKWDGSLFERKQNPVPYGGYTLSTGGTPRFLRGVTPKTESVPYGVCIEEGERTPRGGHN